MAAASSLKPKPSTTVDPKYSLETGAYFRQPEFYVTVIFAGLVVFILIAIYLYWLAQVRFVNKLRAQRPEAREEWISQRCQKLRIDVRIPLEDIAWLYGGLGGSNFLLNRP
jgi:hypothetical protein